VADSTETVYLSGVHALTLTDEAGNDVSTQTDSVNGGFQLVISVSCVLAPRVCACSDCLRFDVPQSIFCCPHWVLHVCAVWSATLVVSSPVQ
jgi:hypothetical protein